jgi:hypothetical protein
MSIFRALGWNELSDKNTKFRIANQAAFHGSVGIIGTLGITMFDEANDEISAHSHSEFCILTQFPLEGGHIIH